MKKILIVSTVSRQFYLFEQGNIEVLKSLGYEVHAAANFSDANERLDDLDIIRHHFDIGRSPFSLKNIKAYKQLKNIINSESFDVIHCHSPMGGVLTRLAAKSVENSTVIYTAHGFHFYNGAPKKNWIFYYTVEKYLSKFTDLLITINKEDYERAKSFNCKEVVYVPGIGVDTTKFNKMLSVRNEKRKELGISNNTTVLLSIGELIKRKNHKTVLRAISRLENQNIVYLICGKGEQESNLKELVRSLDIEEKVRFLGFRNDIEEICLASDLFVFPSYQEGLPVSLMEAMSAGLPIVCSSIRGNTDLIENGKGGFLLRPDDDEGFTKSIDIIITDTDLRKRMSDWNISKVKKFDKSTVKEKMKTLYSNLK